MGTTNTKPEEPDDLEHSFTTIVDEGCIFFPLEGVIEILVPFTIIELTNPFNCSVIVTPTEAIATESSYTVSTIVGSVVVHKGKWYYETTIKSAGSIRVGWCSKSYIGTTQPIGTNEHSWAFDGTHSKKYHNNFMGEAYGDWCVKGDVIGTILDLDGRKISFTKNGKDLGFAFKNIRVSGGLSPAISLSGGTKVEVNFGSHSFLETLPNGVTSLYPSMTYLQRDIALETFKLYSEDKDKISGNGLLQLGKDLGLEDPTSDPILLILAWKIHSKTQWVISQAEWMTLWALYKVLSLGQLKTLIQNFKKDLSTDLNQDFKTFYTFSFDYIKVSPTATVLEVSEAIMLWKLCGIPNRWALFDSWEKFWKVSKIKGINRDTWVMLLSFIDTIGTDIPKYQDSDCWPSIFDDFVESLQKKGDLGSK